MDDEAAEDNDISKNNEEDVDEKMPVPQVKVGPNGEIIIDEESTIIETTAAKKAKEDLLKSPLIFENANNQTSHYGTWGKRKKSSDWSRRETIRFFKALSVFGTDFSMMEAIFKKRSRQELKLKFKKEERQNRALVDKCLREGMQFDISVFHSDSEDEIEVEKREAKAKRRRSSNSSMEKKTNNKKPKKRVRKVKSNRGYYSSSDADESGTTSDSDGRRVSLERPRPITKEPPSLLKSLLEKGLAETCDNNSPTNKSIASSSPLQSPPPSAMAELAFPPGLLAANPDLASAVPGSLVVVASPAENDPQQQMLHVYRVQDDSSKEVANVEENENVNSETRTEVTECS